MRSRPQLNSFLLILNAKAADKNVRATRSGGDPSLYQGSVILVGLRWQEHPEGVDPERGSKRYVGDERNESHDECDGAAPGLSLQKSPPGKEGRNRFDNNQTSDHGQKGTEPDRGRPC